MKRTFLLLLSVILFACNDGDLQIASIDFDSVSIQTCESTITTSSTVFFKINGEEALILELQSGLLQNVASQDTIISAIPTQSSLIYRLFDGTVNTNYFCDAIPLTSPGVLEEIEATVGEVLISTIQNASDSTQFDHTIQLRNISLINEQGERVTNVTINDFGTITTSQ
ncbi:hypothetical protein [Muriicola sp.]|uniref:hypothetical protein n=1 Tax=Muriicola sp. TaxID=2020856 RepID=UPI003C732671